MLLALLALVVSVSMWGADVSGALFGVTKTKLTYSSVDANNNPITLSAQIYYKGASTINFVMLNCHPTITHNAGCPSGTKPQMEVIRYMVSENCLLICPDYIGFGSTSTVTHPYMCSTLTARNVLDAYKAAILHVRSKGCTISSDYYTVNVGYSQGGATALAFQKYLEMEATDDDRALVNLKGSVCGAGPYSQNLVFDTYEQWCKEGNTLDYPIYLLYCLQGHREAFGETIMRGLSLEECFTPEFWSYIHTRKAGESQSFMEKLAGKELNVDQLNDILKGDEYNTFYKIISANYANRSSKVYRIIQKVLDQSNLLKEGWTPNTPIIFYHERTGKDIVVPYACTEAAMSRFEGKCSYVDAIADYSYDRSAGDNYLWHAAAFRKYWGSDAEYPGQATIMTLAGITGNDSYDFDELSHRAFGARFYVQFLAERKCMRPQGTAGTGDITKCTMASPSAVAVAANASSEEGSYDRITTAMPYAIPADKPVLLQFAAPVDGYYFGADAPRYEVTLSADGEAVSYEEMADDADFEAGKVYLVTSEREETAPVVSMTAGVKTATVASDLAWRELNIRKLNVVNGRSYASAYMPFAYATTGGTYAYAVSSPSNGKVKATLIDGEVPAATGVLLIKDGEEGSVVLSPVTDGRQVPAIETILTGTYEEMTHNSSRYILFGKATNGSVGFYKFQSLGKIKAYSAFIDLQNASVKGYDLTMDEEDCVGEVEEARMVPEAFYGIDGRRLESKRTGVNIWRMKDGSVRKVVVK